jgi:hypothetical protein
MRALTFPFRWSWCVLTTFVGVLVLPLAMWLAERRGLDFEQDEG